MRSTTISLAAPVVALLAVACSAEPGRGGPNAIVDTLPDGRVRVANTGEPAWPAEGVWRLEEDLRLGTAEENGPVEQQFGFIVDLATDSRGRIFVLDALAAVVRVFGSDGAYLHDVGAPGEGPGELAEPVELSMAPGDTLWVADQRTAVYSIFAPQGTFARVLRQPNFLSSVRGRVIDGGRYVQWGFAFPNDEPGRVDVLPIRVGPTSGVADTFPPIRYAQRLMENGAPAVFFSPRPTGAVDAEGSVWFALTDAYEIHRRTLAGDTILTVTLVARPHLLDEADRAYVDSRVSSPASRFREEYLAALPEVRPILGRIVLDGAGHIYVLADVEGEPAGTVLDVFAEGGAYLGRLRLPSPVDTTRPVIHVTRDHVYVVVTDELDVQYVSRLRIVRPKED